MKQPPNPVNEEELHSFVDGQLEPGQIARVEEWLATHPEDAEKVHAWWTQNAGIAALFAPYEMRLPSDGAAFSKANRSARARHRWGWQIAAAIAIFALGTLTGGLITSLNSSGAPTAAIYTQASSAFKIYASEVRHPVEVRADEKDHMVAWLGKRLGQKLTAPDLSDLGFSLVGGRLVPVDGQAGALMMYEDKSGKRLIVLLGHGKRHGETSFRYASAGSVETFYWIDGSLTYAVTGEISRDRLKQVADDCYRQFQMLS